MQKNIQNMVDYNPGSYQKMPSSNRKITTYVNNIENRLTLWYNDLIMLTSINFQNFLYLMTKIKEF